MSYYKSFLEGCAVYINEEKRDAMYRLARRLVSEAQWEPDDLAF